MDDTVVEQSTSNRLIAQIFLNPIETPLPSSPISESAQSIYFFKLFSNQLPISSKWFQRFYSLPILLHQFNSTINHKDHITASNWVISTINGQLINLRSISHPNHHHHHHHHHHRHHHHHHHHQEDHDQQLTFDLNEQKHPQSVSSISTSKPINPSRPGLSPSTQVPDTQQSYPLKPSGVSIYSDSSRSSSTSSISLGHHSIKASPTVSISLLNNPISSDLNNQLESLQLDHRQYQHQHHQKQPPACSPHQTDDYPNHLPKKDHSSPKHLEPRSTSQSPTSSTFSFRRPFTRSSISHPFTSLWQGSAHQQFKPTSSSSLSTIINDQSKDVITSPPNQPQQHDALLPSPTLSNPHPPQLSPFDFSSSTLVNPSAYSDPIVSIITVHIHQSPFLPSIDQSPSQSSSFHRHVHVQTPQDPSSTLIFTLSKFGKCSKLSSLDGHIIHSLDLCQSDGLIQFDDWMFLKPEEEDIMSDGDENIETQADPLILCVSSETQPVIINSVDFKVLASKYSNFSTEQHDRFYKTKIWKQSRTDINKWTIKLLSLSWSKKIWTRELNVFEDNEGEFGWIIQESQEPILLKALGDELDFGEEQPAEIVVNPNQFAVWSADRFWVFETSSSSNSKEKEGQLRASYSAPWEASSQIPCQDDLIVSLSFLGSFGILVVSKKHVKLFHSIGSECTINGWSEWKVRPIDGAGFTLDSPYQFEFAINNSIVPSSIEAQTDLIKTINILTIDLDFSTGQRRFSELSFSTEATNVSSDNVESSLEEDKTASASPFNPPVHPRRRDLYLSGSITRPNDPPSIGLTCSIWLEDDHRPTILVGDSQGQISVYSLNILSHPHLLAESSWNLERLVEEEQLVGPVSALYADQQWILAGGVSGDVGIWLRNTRRPVASGVTDFPNEFRLVDRMMMGPVPVESFGRLPNVEHVPDPGAGSNGLSRFVSVMMDGSAVVFKLNDDGMIEVIGELGPPDTSLGISDMWSNGPEIVIFYRERELGAQRWLCSDSLWAHLGRQEAKTMIEVENGQPLTTPWVQVALSNSGAYTTLNPSAELELSTIRVVNVSGMTAFNTLSVRIRDFVEAIGLQDGDALVGRLSIVRLMVSQLLPWGLDPALDEAAEHGLGISRLSVEERSEILQVINGDRDEQSGLALYRANGEEKVRSEHANTYRLLNLVVLLRVFLNEGRYERHASETIVGLAKLASKPTSSSDDSTAAWLDLSILVRYWLDPSTEVREAARLLFGVRLGSMTNEEIERIVASWQGLLPIQEITPHTKSDKDWTFGRKAGSTIHKDVSLKHASHLSAAEKRGDADKQLDALLLIGLIVSERYKALSSKVLKDLSIAVFQTISPTGQRSDQLSQTRVEMLRAGFEICSKTFEIIQNYIDAIELVRNLFGWATAKDGDLAPDVKGVAKYACLHVASVNTPLFMTTLSYDLSISQNPVDRISTMKLVVFMVRKRPLVLHTSLPRLLEAVVKSLDPTQKQMRAQTQTGATVILHELVKTYPSITFHGRSQKLAIGTPEGAIVIYDLKTGTKMDILESFRTPVAAASFSGDGQRLVAVSLDENRIEIWKFASSPFAIGSFFNFASSPSPSVAPSNSFLPRFPSNSATGNLEHNKQHHGSSKPFKSLSFNVGEEALMSIAGTLEWVRIEWLGERSCRLRIRQSSITFSC